MQTENWRNIAELVGILAIVSSLIFVGLQLKQSQDIAIASQYHDRAALAVENFHAHMEAGNLEGWGRGSGLELTSDFSAEDAGLAFLGIQAYMAMADNHLYQYESGFMDESAWQAQRMILKGALTGDSEYSEMFRAIFHRTSVTRRESFVRLCNQILQESDEISESN